MKSLKKIKETIRVLIFNFLCRFRFVYIVNVSMEPTIKSRSMKIVDTSAYISKNPKRLDVVMVMDPSNNERNLIKRVVGLPGEYVEFKFGEIFIDEHPILHPVPLSGIQRTYYWRVADDEVVLLGDNIANSTDSRHFGPINVSNIVGKLV
ncbi:MAG: signal peptidase I [Dehalococcoidia bacterium]|nr:signal peptidase I [Chloroflexota bacterium]MDP7232186.1 signal peptidase I [Dehalococcoidia bacterium]MDP7613486.1 signal peptidase I [Dehalococcoidia bacterium]